MGISRSTVYYKRKTPLKDPLEERVLEIFNAHNGNYGAPRIKVVLAKEDKIISKRRIGKILKKHCLESKHGRRKLARNIHTTQDERFIVENLIKGKKASGSDQICQMDASQFKYQNGKLFINGIIDIFDKTVVVKYGNNENKELISETVKEKLLSGNPGILHTDRGLANASLKVKQLLETSDIKRSMSAPYSPNENQYIETFWKTAKTEIGNTKKMSQAELKMVLNYYMNYYNTERIHSSIGYLTPQQMRDFSRACVQEE
jgi:transposase InsO family protein